MARRLAARDHSDRRSWVRTIPETQLPGIACSGRLWLQVAQMAPPGDWRLWMIMAGRGFGKTFAGSHWVHAQAMAGDASTRIGLVGATMADVRAVMVEGESGLLAIAAPSDRPVWYASRGVLNWPSGATAYAYSAEAPEALRGPQHGFAWCDETGKWAYPEATWDNLQLGLRLGADPRTIATTTPRPTALIKQLIADATTIVTHGRTADNGLLPPAFVKSVRARYGGTRLGRQELDGELVEDVAGALWTRDLLESARVRQLPELRRVVVGVDPPASIGGDACGIVVGGLGNDGNGYVIEDASVAGQSPEGWARAVTQAAARHGADRVIAEGNNGGNMVESVLRAADAGLPVTLVHASRGKVARAEPVALLYMRGLVKHYGVFAALEDELCGLVTGGGYAGPGRSPDRADACVWALTELVLGRQGPAPRVRVV